MPSPVVMALSQVDRGQGGEDLFRNQVPDLLTQLAHRARMASVTASDWRPLNVGLLLHLHRTLFTHTPVPGGHFKESDNPVVDRSPDGSVTVRFRPVPAARTERFTSELVDRYQEALIDRRHHPVLLVGLFVLDLLTIHPFSDGNGRVARVLANALLAECEYGVGRYVSVEQLIAESADGYHQALLASTHGWHEQSHDPWPWLEYFVGVVARAYSVLAAGVAEGRTAGTRSERVRDHVLHHSSRVFAISDVRAALPGISDPTIRLVLHQLRSEGHIRPEGTGRSAVWVRAGHIG